MSQQQPEEQLDLMVNSQGKVVGFDGPSSRANFAARGYRVLDEAPQEWLDKMDDPRASARVETPKSVEAPAGAPVTGAVPRPPVTFGRPGDNSPDDDN